MNTTSTASHRPLPTTFDELHGLHPLRPIRDAVDYDNAVEMVVRLAVLDQRQPDQDDYLETLVALQQPLTRGENPPR